MRIGIEGSWARCLRHITITRVAFKNFNGGTKSKVLIYFGVGSGHWLRLWAAAFYTLRETSTGSELKNTVEKGCPNLLDY